MALSIKDWTALGRLARFTPVIVYWVDAVGGADVWKTVEESGFHLANVISMGQIYLVTDEMITILMSVNSMGDCDSHLSVPKGMVEGVKTLANNLLFGKVLNLEKTPQ